MRAVNLKLDDAPDGGGLYVLVLRAERGLRGLRVGSLGRLDLPAGYYCYVGSARRGLKARLARHLRRTGKRAHWHVDYLRRRARPVEVFVAAVGAATECGLSDAVAALADGSVRGFGSSDCRCAGHLHYFRRDPGDHLRTLEPRG
jgi:sugar fermentation stimulation protein A